MTDQLPTIERHTFKQFKDNPECTYVEPGPGRQCREPKDHLVHTPNGCSRKSWLETKLNAGGLKSRDAGRLILDLSQRVPDNREDHEKTMAAVVEALHELVDETSHWKNAWAHEHVDKDHQVRNAMARSESCEHHGEEIKALGAQVADFEAAYHHADNARAALLPGLHVIEEFCDAIDVKVRLGEDLPAVPAMVEFLRKTLKKTYAAHHRAWQK